MATEDCIRRRAYEIWEQKGKPEGRSEEHWTQARREIEGPQRRRFLWLASAGAVLATALLPGLANIMWQVGGQVYDTYSVEALRAGALPTERDKIDGQRQLKSVQVSLQPKNGQYLLSFRLRVHRYLGTQFKLYATAKNPLAIQEVVKKLKDVSDKDENCTDKFDVDFSDKPTKIMCVTQGGIRNEKVFFLVDKYNSARSAEGRIINNFANPGGT
jgi:Protein of unknown function (DUF2934)